MSDNVSAIEAKYIKKYEAQQKIDFDAQPILAACSTKALCEELRKRQGVEDVWIEPYKSRTIIASGPMSLMFIVD